MVLYDVPPLLEDDEVQALVKQLDGDVSVDSITGVSWTLGDMALFLWRLKGGGVLGPVGSVLSDHDIEASMYLIANRQYNALGSRMKKAAGKHKAKGKGACGGENPSAAQGQAGNRMSQQHGVRVRVEGRGR